MNTHHRDKPNPELDHLYEQARHAEPDTGLDRIIRARADQALRRNSRLPWLAGLTTASVAIVAVAVVLQQQPSTSPDGRTLESPAPRALSESASIDEAVDDEDDLARLTATGARTALTDRAPANSDRARTEGPKDRGEATSDAVPESAPDPAPAEDAAPSAPAAERPRPRPAFVSPPPGYAEIRRTDDAAAVAELEPEQVLEMVHRLIEAGRDDGARELLRRLQQAHPEFAIPEATRKWLEADH